MIWILIVSIILPTSLLYADAYESLIFLDTNLRTLNNKIVVDTKQQEEIKATEAAAKAVKGKNDREIAEKVAFYSKTVPHLYSADNPNKIDIHQLNNLLRLCGLDNSTLEAKGYFQGNFTITISKDLYGPFIYAVENSKKEITAKNKEEKAQLLPVFRLYLSSLEYEMCFLPLPQNLPEFLYNLLAFITIDHELKNNIRTIHLSQIPFAVGSAKVFTIKIRPQLGKRSAELVLEKLYTVRDKLKNAQVPVTLPNYTALKDHENPSNIFCWYTQGPTHKSNIDYFEPDRAHFKKDFLYKDQVNREQVPKINDLFPLALSWFEKWRSTIDQPTEMLPPIPLAGTIETYHLKHPAGEPLPH